jgi:alanine racemase
MGWIAALTMFARNDDGPMTITHNGPILEVDLAAIARNYALLKGKLAGGACAAVVKAGAYGLGVKAVAPALFDAGCRDFFVATLDEAIELRAVLDDGDEPRVLLGDHNIYVFHGMRERQNKDFTHHRLIPVLSSHEQIRHWNNSGPCALHIDTGMNRLGLPPEEARDLQPATRNLQLVMSHLACASEPQHPMNEQQLGAFTAALAHFPRIPASLANSSGIFLGERYHFALARAGCSLYGISPDTARPNPMENVVTLSAPVLQYRFVKTRQSVGYGATASVPAGAVLATVELGYADGFLRHLSNHAHGFAAGYRVPLVGRVSMDMVSLDVTGVPEHLRTPDLRIIFIGREQPVDALAKDAGTIGYEVFTRLGSRVQRVYGD